MNSNLKASLNFAHENFQDFVDKLSEFLRLKLSRLTQQIQMICNRCSMVGGLSEIFGLRLIPGY